MTYPCTPDEAEEQEARDMRIRELADDRVSAMLGSELSQHVADIGLHTDEDALLEALNDGNTDNARAIWSRMRERIVDYVCERDGERLLAHDIASAEIPEWA